MHLYIMGRGIISRLNQWENDLSAQYFPFEAFKGVKNNILQFAVRPIRIYEMAFPEPYLNDVLKMIQPTQSWNPAYNKYISIIRKVMKLEKMPKTPPEDERTRFLCRNWVEACGIGIKKDRYENGIELI